MWMARSWGIRGGQDRGAWCATLLGCGVSVSQRMLGSQKSFSAELLAILYGLRLCWERGYKHIVVFSDSKLALSLLEHGCGRFHVYAVVIGLIQRLIVQNWVVRFEHILLEGNSVADLLTKDGARGNFRLLCLETPPVAVVPLLMDDYRGTLFMRCYCCSLCFFSLSCFVLKLSK